MNIAMILGAGTGSRMGKTPLPKQFMLINNKPLIVYSLEVFQNHSDIDEIIIVASDNFISKVKKWCDFYHLTKVKAVISGGNTRQKSVYNGIKYLESINTDEQTNLLIHDGARPNITDEIISRNIESCNKFHAVNTVIPCSDTISKSIDGKTILEIQKRSQQYQGQTPQTFKFGLIKKAHQEALKNSNIEVTDDCLLVKNINHDVYLVQGSKLNFKITTQEDIIFFEALLNH